MNFTNEQIIEVFSVYNRYVTEEDLNDAIDFRRPKYGEKYLSATCSPHEVMCLVEENVKGKRLITSKAEKYLDGDTCYNISVKQVYKKDKVLIPNGYEFVRFGLAKEDELFIDLNGKTVCESVINWTTNPRIIVKKNEG